MPAVNHQPIVGVKTDQGPNRPHNEDAYSLPPNGELAGRFGYLYVVADGVGGLEAGDLAANIAVNTVQKFYYQEAQKQPNAEISALLNNALQFANKRVFEEGRRLEKRLGCTIVAVVVKATQFFVAHIGDARVYRASPTALQQMTRDHSWVQEQVEQGVLTEEQARNHDFRNLVQRVLGREEAVQVTISGGHTFAENEILLLCSDGLNDTVQAEIIFDRLISAHSAQAIADQLVQDAISRDAGDNITVLVVQAGGDEAAQTEVTNQPFEAAPVAVQTQVDSSADQGSPHPYHISNKNFKLIVALLVAAIFLLLIVNFSTSNRANRIQTASPSEGAQDPVSQSEDIVPTDSSTTNTPAPTSTAVASVADLVDDRQFGCLVLAQATRINKWRRDQIDQNECRPGTTELTFSENQTVILKAIITAPAPDNCNPYVFRLVQPIETPSEEWWVDNFQVQEGACQ